MLRKIYIGANKEVIDVCGGGTEACEKNTSRRKRRKGRQKIMTVSWEERYRATRNSELGRKTVRKKLRLVLKKVEIVDFEGLTSTRCHKLYSFGVGLVLHFYTASFLCDATYCVFIKKLILFGQKFVFLQFSVETWRIVNLILDCEVSH